jgi:CRP-like cAMP-binding protein
LFIQQHARHVFPLAGVLAPIKMMCMNQGLDTQPPPALLIAALRTLAAGEGLWRQVEIAKGRPIQFQAEPDARLIVVEHGLVKLSYLSGDGEERIKSFIADMGVFGEFERASDLPYEAVCLEPSRIVALPINWARQRLADAPDLQLAVGSFLSWLSAKKRDREHALLCMTPAERYLDLQRREPGLVSRLPQGDIARYLGVTPIAFSRIKRRLRQGEMSRPPSLLLPR